MKVICISEGNYASDMPILVVGNYYTVIDVREEPYADKILLLYILKECGLDNGYGRANFAPLSDIDEREFVRDYNKETV